MDHDNSFHELTPTPIHPMDSQESSEDQVVPGSQKMAGKQSGAGSPSADTVREVPSRHSTPTMDSVLRTGTIRLQTHSVDSVEQERELRDSGYLSTPGTVSSETHFFDTSDVDGSFIHRHSVGEEDEDGDSGSTTKQEEHTDDDSVFMGDNDEESLDISDGRQDNSSNSSHIADQPQLDRSLYLGNTDSNGSSGAMGYSENQSPSFYLPGDSEISDNQLQGEMSTNPDVNNVPSVPIAIPKKRRSHYLDNFTNHTNVFHTPPRGYHYPMTRGKGARSSTGSIQTFSTHFHPSSSTSSPHTPAELVEHARRYHEENLEQSRNKIVTDKNNPRRARFFSESLYGNEATMSEDGLHAPVKTRDRSLSAPTLLTLEEFGEQLRKISDDFDREYTSPLHRPSQRHGRNSDNRRSFPGTQQNDPGWWEKFIQWLPIAGTHGPGMARHRTEPVLRHLQEEEEEENEDSGNDEVDGIFES